MVYTKDVTTPANTLVASPLRSIFRVTKGLVYKIEVQFPPGCAGLCHIGIFDGAYQAWPSSPEATWYGDGITISYDDTYLKEASPLQFDILSYNLDDTYEHTIQVRIGMVSHKVFMARFLPTMTWEYFADTLKELRAEQEARFTEIREHPFTWIEE